jgi:hypothetical protein
MAGVTERDRKQAVFDNFPSCGLVGKSFRKMAYFCHGLSRAWEKAVNRREGMLRLR